MNGIIKKEGKLANQWPLQIGDNWLCLKIILEGKAPVGGTWEPWGLFQEEEDSEIDQFSLVTE